MKATHNRILIVEDDRIICEDIKKYLRENGYAVSGIVTSGEDALEFIEQNPVDLVLLDIVLTGELNGIDTAEQIRSQRDIPVVFVTAYSDRITLDRIREVGPAGYIIKPFREQELMDLVADILPLSE